MRPGALAGASLFVLLFALPSVSACSLAETPPLPAHMWIWDIEEAKVIDQVDTWTRGLGASCGLQKPVDLDGGRLVYADRVGDSMGVWLLTPGEGPPRPVFRLDGEYQALDLDLDLLSIYMETVRHSDAPRDRAAPARYGHVFTVDLATGEAERLDLTPDRLGDPRVEDGLLYWAWVDRADHRHRLNVYDLRERTWVHENVSYVETFGLGERTRLSDMNARWMLLADEGVAHAWDREDATMHVLALSGEGLGALDGDLLYLHARFDKGVEVMRLPDGQPRALPDPAHPVIEGTAFDDGWMVLGVYSHGDTSIPVPGWMERPELEKDFVIPSDWRHERPGPWFLDLPGPHVFFVVLAVLTLLRAWRQRSDR